MQKIGEYLRDTTYNGFPVIGEEQRPIGLISRHVLMKMLGKIDQIPNCASREYLLSEQTAEECNNIDSDMVPRSSFTGEPM